MKRFNLIHVLLLSLIVVFQNCAPPLDGRFNDELIELSSKAPTLELISKPEKLININSAEITFSTVANKVSNITQVLYSLDGQSFSATTTNSQLNLTNLSDGAHSVILRAIDSRGNESDLEYTFEVDTTKPLIVINQAPSSQSNQMVANIVFTSTDNYSGVVKTECALDSEIFVNCTSPYISTGLNVGDHFIKIKATDKAGHISLIQQSNWTIDLTAPTLTISSSPSNISNSKTANFQFSALDGNVQTAISYMCRIDALNFTSCVSPVAYNNLTDGSHRFEVQARDSAGNISSVVAFNWQIDTVVPTALIVSGPLSLTTMDTATFNFTALDNVEVKTIECKFNALAYVACTNPFLINNISSGPQSFSIRVTDNAGNITVSPIFNWTVDRSPPQILTQPMAKSVLAGSSVSFSVIGRSISTINYQWRKNSVNIPSATNSTLSLNNVTINDAGSYTVTLTNEFGFVTSAVATLTVTAGDNNPPGTVDPLPQDWTPPADGKNWYVRPSAQGLADGTSWNNAWSLGQLNTQSSVKPGDTVWIAGGNYPVNTGMNIAQNGTSARKIFIRRVLKTDPVPTKSLGWSDEFDSLPIITAGTALRVGRSNIMIDGRFDMGMRFVASNRAGLPSSADVTGGNTVMLRYLDFVGPNSVAMVDGSSVGSNFVDFVDDTSGVKIGYGYSPNPGADNITISFCRLRGHVNELWFAGARNIKIQNSKLYDNGAKNFAQWHGNLMIVNGSDGITFSNNEVYNWQTEGLYPWGSVSRNWKVYGNLFHDGYGGKNGATHRFLEIRSYSGSVTHGPFFIYNNTIVNAWAGITRGDTTVFWTADSEAKNNIFWNLQNSGIGYAPPIVSNNFTDATSAGGAGSISSGLNPFVKILDNMFNIVSLVGTKLPANKGVTLADEYKLDANGNMRGADGVWDIGAFEAVQ